MQKIHNPLRDLTKFELVLWLTSLLISTASFLLSPEKDPLTLIASLVGFTALIFTAKGFVWGQILIVIFATLYGIISYRFAYYGEMITYLGMSLPVAIVAIASWLRHPYKESAQVAVHRMRGKEWLLLSLLGKSESSEPALKPEFSVL